jgi:pyruvate dehydrogenase E2 component (dihydrolipoamide acetyltransferase)
MANPITIPRLGWNMEEGHFVAWIKLDGDQIAAGEPLFSLEGDKATQDVESLEAGILRIAPDGPKEGERVAVGDLIGYLVAAGEAAPFEQNERGQFREGEPPREPACDGARTEPRPPIITNAQLETRAALNAVPAARQTISPRARRVARELGVDTTALRGTGASGRIRERDVRAAASATAAVHHDGERTGAARTDEFRELPITAVRRTIAERMLQSVHTTAAVTLTTTVDATNLVNLRAQFKAVAGASGAAEIGITEIVVKLAAVAIEHHPLLQARWDGDRIVVPTAIHIGVAVDTDAGLFVPVIRDVARLSLRHLAATSRDLIARARSATLTAAELRGGTFTITNLGPLGIETFTPLVNPPECAVLGLGRIARQAVVDQNQLVARDRMFLSLTFDHRIVDGAPAARFLQSVAQLIENPSPWLVS